MEGGAQSCDNCLIPDEVELQLMAGSHEISGEDSIVQTYLRPLAAHWPGAFDLRDDCALISPAPGHELVVKTDPHAVDVAAVAGRAVGALAELRRSP